MLSQFDDWQKINLKLFWLSGIQFQSLSCKDLLIFFLLPRLFKFWSAGWTKKQPEGITFYWRRLSFLTEPLKVMVGIFFWTCVTTTCVFFESCYNTLPIWEKALKMLQKGEMKWGFDITHSLLTLIWKGWAVTAYSQCEQLQLLCLAVVGGTEAVEQSYGYGGCTTLYSSN